MPKEKNTTIVTLSGSARELFKKMNFAEEIPESATHIAFTDDGQAMFLQGLDMRGQFMAPQIAMLMYYTDIDLTFDALLPVEGP